MEPAQKLIRQAFDRRKKKLRGGALPYLWASLNRARIKSAEAMSKEVKKNYAKGTRW